MTTPQNPPLPSPPFYTISNINNLRDAALSSGGLTTSSGASIRPGVLFRSAEVSKLDSEGWKAIHDLGISHVFDLRSKPEVDKGWKGVTGEAENGDGKDVRAGWEESMKEVGVSRVWCPVFNEADYSPERLAERYMKYMGESTDGFVQAYRDILMHAGPAFAAILRYLANLPRPGDEDMRKVGALIHCTAGKDRTGIFFAILFSFLGVSNSAIAEEYNLTELGLGHMRDEIAGRVMQSPGFRTYALSQMAGKELNAEHLADALKSNADGRTNGAEVVIPEEVLEKGRRAVLRMVGARRESMFGALEMVGKEWGSAEEYMKQVCGMQDGELEALRRNLVVES